MTPLTILNSLGRCIWTKETERPERGVVLPWSHVPILCHVQVSVEPFRGLPNVPPVETQRLVAFLLPTVSGTAWAAFVPHLNGPVLTVGYHDDPSSWDFQHVPVHLIPVLVSFRVVVDPFGLYKDCGVALTV